MAKFKIVKGNFKDTDWELKKSVLSSGYYNKLEIPMTEVTDLTQKEKIGKEVYADFKLGTGQTFTAKMREKDYKEVYEIFISEGDNPQLSQLPIEKKSIKDIVWSVISLLFIIVLVFGESDKTDKNSTSRDWDEVDAITYCQLALENSAKYGARFPSGLNKTATRYLHNDNKFSVIMGAEIKNGFGTWGKSTVSCIVNGQRVDKLVVDGSVIWDNS